MGRHGRAAFGTKQRLVYDQPGARKVRTVTYIGKAGSLSSYVLLDGAKVSVPTHWLRPLTPKSKRQKAPSRVRQPTAARGVEDHRWFKSGEGKTVCTSAVLAAFGIDACSYNYSGRLTQRQAILRKFGWAVRSRKSKLPKGTSVGGVRRLIAAHKWGDPVGTRYMIRVQGHALLLDWDGNTIVDTAPRKRDRRTILAIHAVFINPNRA